MAVSRRLQDWCCIRRLNGSVPSVCVVCRGYIVDVSLKGTSVEPDVDDMEAAYGEGTTPADVLQGRVKPPKQAQLLYNALAALQSTAAGL